MARQNAVGTHATTISTDDGVTFVCYHETDVVQFGSHTIVLDSGGWRTVTTKLRMNQTSQQFDLGFQVYQKNFEWFVDHQGKTIAFADGMVLTR